MDSAVGAPPARLIVLHPNVKQEQELVIKGGDGIIVARDGSLKYSTNNKIVPVDFEGQDLNRK